jgi:hypothetical protein
VNLFPSIELTLNHILAFQGDSDDTHASPGGLQLLAMVDGLPAGPPVPAPTRPPESQSIRLAIHPITLQKQDI